MSHTASPMLHLPIDPSLPEIVGSLRETPTLVIDAPPGAGKTTRVPRALLDAGFAERGQIVVVEPRRLAARLGARRVAEELGERVGESVGYSVHFEEVSSERTRIRFVTEGVLERKLLTSPRLEGIGVIVFDEVHERHVHGDVALALAARMRRRERPDLRIVAMSATLATGPLAAFLGAPVVRTVGRRFDVAIDHLPSPDDRPVSSQVASAVRRLVLEGLDGDILVFLPGASEIRQAATTCEKLAAEAGLRVVVLHGDPSFRRAGCSRAPAGTAQGHPLDQRRRILHHDRRGRRGHRLRARAGCVAGSVVGIAETSRRKNQPGFGGAACGSRRSHEGGSMLAPLHAGRLGVSTEIRRPRDPARRPHADATHAVRSLGTGCRVARAAARRERARSRPASSSPWSDGRGRQAHEHRT